MLIPLHPKMIGFNIKKSLCSFQNISCMPQDILQILICLIRNICKQTKCRNIDKNVIIKLSRIKSMRNALHNICGCLKHVSGDMKAVGKIIGTARRYIADGMLMSCCQHSGNHFIQGSVPSTGYNQVIVSSSFFRHFQAVHISLGGMNRNLIAAFYENIQNIHQPAFNTSFSGSGIKNKKHFFTHGSTSLFCWKQSTREQAEAFPGKFTCNVTLRLTLILLPLLRHLYVVRF